MRLSARIDATASRVQTAVTMKQVCSYSRRLFVILISLVDLRVAAFVAFDIFCRQCSLFHCLFLSYMHLTGDWFNGWSCEINGFCYEVHELRKGVLMS